MNILAGYQKLLKREELLMFALTSKSVYSNLIKFPSFKLRILTAHLMHRISKNRGNSMIEESTILHGHVTHMIRIDCLLGDIRSLTIYKTVKTVFPLQGKVNLAESCDVSRYLKEHSLSQNLVLYQIETAEHDCFESGDNIIKHEKWILFGNFEIVKKKADILFEYLTTFVNLPIRTIDYL